jgi:TonB family protein
MQKRLIFTLLCILSFALTVAAQNTPPKAKIVAKGVVNGAAVSLPKPVYPPAAQAVKASGAVEVQVVIDEEGNVIQATASSGHPLLQQAAVEAARQAKFKPTLLNGQPVKVTGRIVYNFVPGAPETKKEEDAPLWVFGFLFSFLENADSELIRLIGDEKEFEAIFAELGTELLKDVPTEIAAEKPLLEKFAKAKGDERRVLAGELNRALKKYFTPTELWQVELGENMGALAVEIVKQAKNVEAGLPIDDSLIKMNLARLKTTLESVPPEITAEQLKLFKPIAEFASRDLKSRENLAKLHESIAPLFESFPD